MAQIGNSPVISLDGCGPSIKGLLRAAGMAFTAGVPIRHQWLFENRFSRPFSLDWRPRFFCQSLRERPTRDSK
jgi:enediyne polyketide synthase